MDILSAHRMVTTTQDSLKKIARDFPAIKNVADSFVHWANEKLEEQSEDIKVETALPQKRVKKKKVLPGKIALCFLQRMPPMLLQNPSQV